MFNFTQVYRCINSIQNMLISKRYIYDQLLAKKSKSLRKLNISAKNYLTI